MYHQRFQFGILRSNYVVAHLIENETVGIVFKHSFNYLCGFVSGGVNLLNY